MGHLKDVNNDWIGSLVKELGLVKEEVSTADLNGFYDVLQACRIPERIRQTVTAVNTAVGYQALYLLDFLPPQRSVMRLSLTKRKTEYIIEIVLRISGPTVVFHSMTRIPGPWERYLYGYSRSAGARIAVKQDFNPLMITDEIIKAWISFVLSGFDKKFDPEQYLSTHAIPDVDMGNLLKKVSGGIRPTAGS